ncbi:MAG: hypothetical protein ROZ64_18030 [Burkholderiaceae bacterium]|jgi:hypothetical protein|nr:hypothetical protein [Burkholderiaceae bacterium]
MSSIPSTTPVHIADSDLAQTLEGLLPVLERLLPVRFTQGREAPGDVVARVTNAVAGHVPSMLSTLVLPAVAEVDAPVAMPIRFADHAAVPWPFRGRTIEARAAVDPASPACRPQPADVILAWGRNGLPIWTIGTYRGDTVHRTALLPPSAAGGVDIGLAAAGDRFIQTLPLIHFLRGLTGAQAYANPPLRASFIIDDPNLHWPRYGFVDYRQIAAGARRDNYHVAFATIPLDAWWVHRSTADIFRAHPGELSLLVHGNDHARHELAQEISPRACAQLLRHAHARIRLLEAKSRLEVSRVMVPPHGACSVRMLAQLPLNGFESACISAGSLRAHNPGQEWIRSLGFAPAETVEGCTVLPRWAFDAASETTLLTAAYLGQPLILRGHHRDLKSGLDILQRFARSINGLGDVRWGSLADLTRLNFRQRIVGRTLHVQPMAARIDVTIPDGVEELQVDAADALWSVVDEDSAASLDGRPFTLPAHARTRYSLQARRPEVIGGDAIRPRSTGAKLIVRRILTEARDRLCVS